MKVSIPFLALLSVSTLGVAAPLPSQPGSKPLTMNEIPAYVRHSAEVALGGVTQNFSFTRAQLDLDETIAIYEIEARSADGRRVEVDVEPSGKIEEIEVQLKREEVPAAVLDALSRYVTDFQPDQDEVLYEKSIRPAKNGLTEIWYEFSGKSFDVEIKSDAKTVVIEPA